MLAACPTAFRPFAAASTPPRAVRLSVVAIFEPVVLRFFAAVLFRCALVVLRALPPRLPRADADFDFDAELLVLFRAAAELRLLLVRPADTRPVRFLPAAILASLAEGSRHALQPQREIRPAATTPPFSNGTRCGARHGGRIRRCTHSRNGARLS